MQFYIKPPSQLNLHHTHYATCGHGEPSIALHTMLVLGAPVLCRTMLCGLYSAVPYVDYFIDVERGHHGMLGIYIFQSVRA